MRDTNPRVDGFLRKTKQWQEEYKALRNIIFANADLTEDVKWRWPCYAFQGKNVVLIHGFKDYCALLFFKGVLLKDPKRLLIQQTEHVQGPRQMRFSSVQQITKAKSSINAYIEEAIAVEKSGIKIPRKAAADFPMPAEFQAKLDKLPALKSAFAALTPGRQRGYLLYFSSAKQSQTRDARVEKYMPKILEGRGMDDE